jgi:ketosteroid isomerase-like protein
VDVEGAAAWLDRYGAAWRERDPDAAVALFTDEATYAETPFAEAMRGRDAIRDYWSAVPRLQREIEFAYEPLAAGADLAVALWQATYVRIADGERVRLDGVFVLRFAPDGRCRELREWWHSDGEPSF